MSKNFWSTSIVAIFFAARAVAVETNGFAVKFTSADGKTTDTELLPNLWLYVEENRPATPFLSPGRFTAVFEGSINAELRGNHVFKVEELGGTVKLEINGKSVFDASAPGRVSEPVQLDKGPNAVRATFTAPSKGDAFLRIGWAEQGTNVNPIANNLIAHSRTAEVEKAQTLRLGRELFLEHRCAKCHTEKFSSPVPELGMDAPGFAGIGNRRSAAWLADWIRDPKATRNSVTMPKLFHGASAREDAEAVAAYLATLKESTVAAEPVLTRPFGYNAAAFAEIDKRSGPNAKATHPDSEEESTPVDAHPEKEPIFTRLHCAACHNAPDSTETLANKISLKHVMAKFGTQKNLAEFLKAPERHFAWTRMPNFKLADSEATELAGFMWKHANEPVAKTIGTEKPLIERGRKLVQNSGCLNCHSAPGLENSFQTISLAKLGRDAKGCLDEKHDDKSKAPAFGFKTAERAALVAYLKTDLQSLQRHSPMEFAVRETRSLNCAECHGHIDLVPGFDVLGGKLKPEWAADFLAGVPFKVRADIHPKGELWTEARMPAFKSRATLLAEGMAMQNGYPPKTRDEGAVDLEAAKIGHKLMGKDNGLSCISCHAVNDLPALEVFESEGPNLGITGARLMISYFFRWMRNPLAVDPQTKMPAFFAEDGRSALTDYYEGDAEKQINALYEYMRLGEKMPKPSTGE